MQTKIIQAGRLNITLPVVPLKDAPISIILFDSFGKTKLIADIAQEVVSTFTKPDIIVCPEAKAIPLAQEMARLWNIDYFVLRKSQKPYMTTPQKLEYTSITSKGTQTLWFDDNESYQLKNKQVMLFDDVISTGGTLRAMLDFSKKKDLLVSSVATIFVEGDVVPLKEMLNNSYSLEYLGFLPLLKQE